MEPLSVIIVDDEAHGRNNLANLLQTHCPGVAVVDMAANAKEVVKKIEQHSPDVVFLDIMMPGISGLEFLESMPSRSFAAVLVTGYSNFGVQAVKAGVADYLMKPIDISELKECVSKIYRQLKTNKEQHQEQSLTEKKSEWVQQRIAISHADGFSMVEINDVVYFQADGNYTRVMLTDGKKLLVSRPLKDFETGVLMNYFLRIHKSYLINIQHVKEYVSNNGGSVMMSDATKIPVSRRKLNNFYELLKKLAIFPRNQRN